MGIQLSTLVIWDFENLKNNDPNMQIDTAKQKMLIERGRGTNVTHVAFVGDFSKNGFQTGFINQLKQLGFETKSKKPKKGINKDGTSYLEVDMDAEIVHFLLTESDFFSTVVMVSGDGDMYPTLKTLQERGIVVEVLALRGRLAKKLTKSFKAEYLTGFKYD
jgi:uncharacterized LabA/DUF88 family protein